MSETNYERYFGTPEKAAEKIFEVTGMCARAAYYDYSIDEYCELCVLYERCNEPEHIAEWLESEAK